MTNKIFLELFKLYRIKLSYKKGCNISRVDMLNILLYFSSETTCWRMPCLLCKFTRRQVAGYSWVVWCGRVEWQGEWWSSGQREMVIEKPDWLISSDHTLVIQQLLFVALLRRCTQLYSGLHPYCKQWKHNENTMKNSNLIL